MAVRERFNQTPSGGLHMLYDEAGQLLVEAKDDGQHRREYIWLGNSHHLLTHVKGAWKAAPNLYFVHNDHQNRPLKMSDTAGQIVWSAVHWPFGKPFEVVKTKGLRLRFPGQWAIGGTGGLSYNWNRFYDPKTGRFTRPDPLGFVDGPSVYAYVDGNPMGFVDADGQQSKNPLNRRVPSPYNYSPKLDGKTDKFHNFPYSFDPQIWQRGSVSVIK